MAHVSRGLEYESTTERRVQRAYLIQQQLTEPNMESWRNTFEHAQRLNNRVTAFIDSAFIIIQIIQYNIRHIF